jgi:hypothetical protein
MEKKRGEKMKVEKLWHKEFGMVLVSIGGDQQAELMDK